MRRGFVLNDAETLSVSVIELSFGRTMYHAYMLYLYYSIERELRNFNCWPENM